MGSARWEFDGNFERPTFSPSLLVTCPGHADPKHRICHSYIRGGFWQFLNDCTHDLAGKTVPMVEVE
jgi:hypothetical protein